MHTFLWATSIWKYLQIEQTTNFEFSATEASLANATIFFSAIGQILDLKVKKFLCIILLIFTIFVRVSRPTFMLYLYDLFLTVIFIFIMINFIISWIQTQMLFCFFFKNISYYFWMISWMKNVNNFQIAKSLASYYCLPFVWFFGNFSLTLLMKVLLVKEKSVITRVGYFVWIVYLITL